MTQEQHKRHHHKKEYSWHWLIINSLCTFLTMFIGLFFIYYLAQLGVARFFGIQSTLYFDSYIFISPSEHWFPKLILVSFSMPILISLFFAIFFYYLLFSLKRTPYLLRLYCLWGHIISVALFFCSFIYGAFTYTGFAVVLLWYKIPTQFNYVLAIFGIVGLSVVGLFLGMWFLKLAPSQYLDVHKKPRQFLVRFALLPYLMGSLIIFFFLMKNWQDSTPLLIVSAGLLLMLLFAIIRREPIEERITVVRHLTTGKFSLFAIIICVLFISLAKYLTINGINL